MSPDDMDNNKGRASESIPSVFHATRCRDGDIKTHASTPSVRQPVRYPKLSYMIDSDSTPRLSSIFTTALDIGPGPHI